MDIADGYRQLPRGKLANAVTWLEREIAAGAAFPARPDCRLQRLGGSGHALYRALYRDIGRDWLWSSRLTMSEAALAHRLSEPGVDAFAAHHSGRPVALLEMELGARGVEIVYFGLVRECFGQGLGRWLMDCAIAAAAERGAGRLWLHTCNFDHPGALRFYQARGFRVYAQGFEVMDDPRALGLLPREAAPHVPMVAD